MFKNFINNIYPKLLEKALSCFDISSGNIVGLWSLVLLVGCTYSIYETKQVTGPVAGIFSTIISAFAGHKMIKVWKGTESSDDTDGQGDSNVNNPSK